MLTSQLRARNPPKRLKSTPIGETAVCSGSKLLGRRRRTLVGSALPLTVYGFAQCRTPLDRQSTGGRPERGKPNRSTSTLAPRSSLGMSQETLGELSGLTFQQVQEHEAGLVGPTPHLSPTWPAQARATVVFFAVDLDIQINGNIARQSRQARGVERRES